jgi:hypothetical protein
MTTNTPTTLTAYLASDENGTLEVFAHNYDGGRLVYLPSAFLAENDFFNEDRAGFSWREDSLALTEIIDMILRNRGWALDTARLAHVVAAVCEPGPGDNDPANFEFTLYREEDV